jgi:hypothetical protein
MERSTASQTPTSEPQHTEVAKPVAAETALNALHIGHEELPSLGSGPILPLWVGRLFKRVRSSH